MHLRWILFTFSVSLLAGCSSTAKQIDPEIEFDVNKSEALQNLTEISIEARDEMRILAKTEQAQSHQTLSEIERQEAMHQQLAKLKDFKQRIDWSYDGPSSSAVEAIGQFANYKVSKFGRPLNIYQEPWVSIKLKDQPLSEGLYEVGLQTGSNIDIRIDEAAKLIRYVYKNVK